jgi:hypothetical protein
MLATYFYNLTNQLWHRTIFSFFVVLSTASFIIDITEIYKVPEIYTNFLHKFINYYIISILIMRFNPLVHHSVRSKVLSLYDQKISFTSGILLLTTNLFNANN